MTWLRTLWTRIADWELVTPGMRREVARRLAYEVGHTEQFCAAADTRRLLSSRSEILCRKLVIVDSLMASGRSNLRWKHRQEMDRLSARIDVINAELGSRGEL